MAITKILARKGRLDVGIRYVLNGDKTQEQILTCLLYTSHILDPFAGSGTTILAAVLEGYTATGIEVTGEYARRARERIEQELRQAA